MAPAGGPATQPLVFGRGDDHNGAMEGDPHDTVIHFVESVQQPPELLAKRRRTLTGLRWVLRVAGGCALTLIITMLITPLISGEADKWYTLFFALPSLVMLLFFLWGIERVQFCPDCNAQYGLPITKPVPAFCPNCQRLLDPARVLLDPPGVLDLTNERYRANSEPVVKLIAVVILLAIKDRSTEIRFEPGDKTFRLCYRCNGVLYDMVPPPLFLRKALSGTLKAMAGLHPEPRPQTGAFRIRTDDFVIVADVESWPTEFGENVIVWLSDDARSQAASLLASFVRKEKHA